MHSKYFSFGSINVFLYFSLLDILVEGFKKSIIVEFNFARFWFLILTILITIIIELNKYRHSVYGRVKTRSTVER